MPHHAPNTARGGASEAETKAYARTHESKYFYNPMTREDRQRAGQGGGKQATLSRDRTEAGERQRMRNRLVAAKQPGRTCSRETAMTEELLPRSCQKETAKAKELPKKKTSRREACGDIKTRDINPSTSAGEAPDLPGLRMSPSPPAVAVAPPNPGLRSPGAGLNQPGQGQRLLKAP